MTSPCERAADRFSGVLGDGRGGRGGGDPRRLPYGPNSEQVDVLLAALAATTARQRREVPVGRTEPAKRAERRCARLCQEHDRLAFRSAAWRAANAACRGRDIGTYLADAAVALVARDLLEPEDFRALTAKCASLLGYDHPLWADAHSDDPFAD